LGCLVQALQDLFDIVLDLKVLVHLANFKVGEEMNGVVIGLLMKGGQQVV
jgi:hypothetical protein